MTWSLTNTNKGHGEALRHRRRQDLRLGSRLRRHLHPHRHQGREPGHQLGGAVQLCAAGLLRPEQPRRWRPRTTRSSTPSKTQVNYEKKFFGDFASRLRVYGDAPLGPALLVHLHRHHERTRRATPTTPSAWRTRSPARGTTSCSSCRAPTAAGNVTRTSDRRVAYAARLRRRAVQRLPEGDGPDGVRRQDLAAQRVPATAP